MKLRILLLEVLAILPATAASAAVLFVDLNSSNSIPPYSEWSAAATNIQDAIDVASRGDSIRVADGVYETGGRKVSGFLTNRVALTKSITVQSVNGPAVTVIKGNGGDGSVPNTNDFLKLRCAYLADGAVLSGFTLTNGATLLGFKDVTNSSGGGVWCESRSAVLSNCVIAGGFATGTGGGAYQGTLIHCLLTNNYSVSSGGGAVGSALIGCVLLGNQGRLGGGAASSTLTNCSIAGNFAFPFGSGGGVASCTLENCVVYFNFVSSNMIESNHVTSVLNHCCTAPLPTSGVGNITDVPLFVDLAHNNLRLQPASPCINSGDNASVIETTGLDGHTRTIGGTVDIGAYEFQAPASVISYAWLYQNGLAIDGSADYLDPDEDGMNNWQEWRAGTNPTNKASVLRIISLTNGAPGVTVTWESVSSRRYFVETSADLSKQASFVAVATNVPGQSGMTSYIVTNVPASAPSFYRVGVQ